MRPSLLAPPYHTHCAPAHRNAWRRRHVALHRSTLPRREGTSAASRRYLRPERTQKHISWCALVLWCPGVGRHPSVILPVCLSSRNSSDSELVLSERTSARSNHIRTRGGLPFMKRRGKGVTTASKRCCMGAQTERRRTTCAPIPKNDSSLRCRPLPTSSSILHRFFLRSFFVLRSSPPSAPQRALPAGCAVRAVQRNRLDLLLCAM